VAALETQRAAAEGNQLFTLRALSAAGEDLASVQLTTGAIADLPALLPGEGSGSELVVIVGSEHVRVVSYETERLVFQPTADSAVARLFAIEAVSATLERETSVAVIAPEVAEAAYSASNCGANLLLTSPVANQCCYSDGYAHSTFYTIFIRPSDHKVIKRYRNPTGLGCRASDGVSACSGDLCYYGPYAFARAQVIDGGSNPLIKTFSSGSSVWCDQASTGTVTYPNVTGTNAPGVGCPGGNPGGSTAWDY